MGAAARAPDPSAQQGPQVRQGQRRRWPTSVITPRGSDLRDGDIVLAADGIAYMCVVDGTTTPPEPWPGANVAINATVDASYWVVNRVTLR